MQFKSNKTYYINLFFYSDVIDLFNGIWCIKVQGSIAIAILFDRMNSQLHPNLSNHVRTLRSEALSTMQLLYAEQVTENQLVDAVKFSLCEMLKLTKGETIAQHIRNVLSIARDLPNLSENKESSLACYSTDQGGVKREEKVEEAEKSEAGTTGSESSQSGQRTSKQIQNCLPNPPTGHISYGAKAEGASEAKVEKVAEEQKVQKNEPAREAAREPARQQLAKDFLLPISLEPSPNYFDIVNHNVVSKVKNDEYRKLRSEKPLPSSGKHTIKIKMVSQGTVAMGLVPQKYSHWKMIDDRNVPAVKYISFFNGGGLINLCGEKKKNNCSVHLNEGEVLTMVYDADAREVTFSNPNLHPFPVQLHKLMGPLHFYLEMKTRGTSVEFLK